MATNTKKNSKCCSKCEKDKQYHYFYKSYSALNSDGYMGICKECIKEMIDVRDLESAKNTLRMIDKPFILHLWESASTKSDVVGEYFKLINAKDFRYFNWANSVFDNSRKVVNKNNTITQESNEDIEYKSYSKKWMGEYTPTDIDYLEDYLRGLHKDFKIVTENHKDYAKKIAKASLYMDTCFRDMLNGVSGADKKYKDAKDVFDTLSKSAQFSESQRGQNEVGLGCFGRVFELVENKTYIPQHIPLEKDDIDKILDDFSHISKSL